MPTTAPIGTIVGVARDTFTPPTGSGGDSFDLADVGLASARFVRIEASAIQRGLNGLSGFDLDAVAAVHSIDFPRSFLLDVDADGELAVGSMVYVARTFLAAARPAELRVLTPGIPDDTEIEARVAARAAFDVDGTAVELGTDALRIARRVLADRRTAELRQRDPRSRATMRSMPPSCALCAQEPSP